MALRGHASIQGSTDVPTLYDLLAGYMPQPSAIVQPQPRAEQHPTATTWGEKRDVPSNVLSQQTLQEYIDIALRLGTEPEHRAAVRAKIVACCGVLYEDMEAVRELERFFQQAVALSMERLICQR